MPFAAIGPKPEVRCCGAKPFSTATSLLPVARSPTTCHVSMISTSARRKVTKRISGTPGMSMRGWPSSPSTAQPPPSQRACPDPLQ